MIDLYFFMKYKVVTLFREVRKLRMADSEGEGGGQYCLKWNNYQVHDCPPTT